MSCLFCRIASGEIPADVIFQDADTVAFRDINPQAPVHVLVIPRKHISGFAAMEEGDGALVGRVFESVARVVHDQGIAESGFRSVVNSGPDAMQTVNHLHVHVLGGRKMSWPPG